MKKDVGMSVTTAETGYKKEFQINFQTLLTFKVGQFVYLNKPPRAFFAYEADKVATVLYKS